MRPAAFVLATVLSIVSLPAAGRPAAAAALDTRIAALASDFPGGAAIWVGDPSVVQPLYARDADEKIVTASLYKLAVLLETEHQVESGHLTYRDTITIDPEDITEDGSFEAPGTELTIDEALEQMITVSDNGTALHLWRMLGPANINAYLDKSGIKDFHVALDEDEDNTASARAVGTYFTLLAKRQLVSPAASDRMLRRLERQEINDRIPAQLPEGTVVAHKTGNLVGLVHDAGIVYTPLGPRVLVAMTWDTDDEVATQFIQRLASTVYSAIVELPASARYRVPTDIQYAELATPLALPVTVENTGSNSWTIGGAGKVGLTWELRDAANNVLFRAPRPLPLGEVAPGSAISLPVIVTMPARPGDAKVVLGLTDSNGNALAGRGVATAQIAVRVHLPFVVEAGIRIPSLLHRAEASMVEVDYTATEPVRAEDHQLALAWRLLDPATGRIVGQRQVPLGIMRTYQRAGSFFAPIVVPNVRGTYTLEYEIRERGFIAGMTAQQTVEIGAPRRYGDEVGPGPSLLRDLQQRGLAPRPSPRPRAAPARTPLPTAAPRPSGLPVPNRPGLLP